MTVTPLEYVQAPALVPPAYGILSAAVVVDDPDPHIGFGFQYDPDFCGPARLTAALCLASAANFAPSHSSTARPSPVVRARAARACASPIPIGRHECSE